MLIPNIMADRETVFLGIQLSGSKSRRFHPPNPAMIFDNNAQETAK
jgi:hypothetical protein